jgi:hypothetical protein
VNCEAENLVSAILSAFGVIFLLEQFARLLRWALRGRHRR